MREKLRITSEKDKVLIVGAGPCGLAASREFQQRDLPNWNLIESQTQAGGLASTLTTEEGFLFDIGGHVIFSHYQQFDEMCDRVCTRWLTHERNAYVYMRDKLIPYPLQKNFGHLPAEEVDSVIMGLQESLNKSETPKDFEEWLRFNFGDGLYDSFLEPYNSKVWAYHPSEMNSTWVGDRVAQISEDEIKAIAEKREDNKWGPNATFRYPEYGGTGSIWTGLADELIPEKQSYGVRMVSIDVEEKEILLSDGSKRSYEFLISTVPLDILLRMLERTGESGLKKVADSFKYSSTHVVGLGMEGVPPEHLKDKSWLYFPEPKIPFYRATVLSNYSPYVVPNPGKQWSLMLEVSESPGKKVSHKLLQDVISSCREIGFIPQNSEIVSTLHRRFEHGYPTPFLERDGLLEMSMEILEKHNIYSRGRFGGWKYEVSNQDHTYMQGVEISRRLLFGEQELTYPFPTIVNGR